MCHYFIGMAKGLGGLDVLIKLTATTSHINLPVTRIPTGEVAMWVLPDRRDFEHFPAGKMWCESYTRYLGSFLVSWSMYLQINHGDLI